jgi:hypothetical protein
MIRVCRAQPREMNMLGKRFVGHGTQILSCMMRIMLKTGLLWVLWGMRIICRRVLIYLLDLGFAWNVLKGPLHWHLTINLYLARDSSSWDVQEFASTISRIHNTDTCFIIRRELDITNLTPTYVKILKYQKIHIHPFLFFFQFSILQTWVPSIFSINKWNALQKKGVLLSIHIRLQTTQKTKSTPIQSMNAFPANV